MKHHFYKVYGLTISSEIELPELQPHLECQADILIKIGKVPEHLPFMSGSGVLFEATKNDFLFKLNSVAKYRAQNGNVISIQPKSNASQEDIRLFLLGSVMGALIQQRGLLAMHGCAISDGTQTIIFTGKSGVGKSSLAFGLHNKGFQILTDDISIIDNTSGPDFYVHAGIPYLKLWKDVLDHLNNMDNLEKVRPKLEKYKMPISINNSEAHSKLNKIVYITLVNNNGFAYSEVSGIEKFYIVRNNSYRIQYIDKMQQTQVHFNRVSELANITKVYRVDRPQYPLRIMEFADFISETFFNIY